MKKSPTIKGIFVNSHIQALKSVKGNDILKDLEKKFGKSIKFRNTQNVPIQDEIELIKACVQIIQGDKVTGKELETEAGRLHFYNFTTTPLARVILPLFRNKFKEVLLKADEIAGRVFYGVHFDSEEVGDRKVRIIMHNNDYSIHHFRGFFEEWMKYSGLKGTVIARRRKDGAYLYYLEWR